MAMWVWRDILVTMLAEENITKSQIKLVLKDIRLTIGDTLYGDLLDLTAIPRINESMTGISPSPVFPHTDMGSPSKDQKDNSYDMSPLD
jgi:hypothetical protein